jgi:hypothetical protein
MPVRTPEDAKQCAANLLFGGGQRVNLTLRPKRFAVGGAVARSAANGSAYGAAIAVASGKRSVAGG